MIEKWLKGKKTYIVSGAALTAVIAVWANGHVGGDTAFLTGLLSALAATLRAGIGGAK
ncbi:MAG: hypothetical protein ACW99U_17765 [Candidatus Thorarchaeota archaeon]|jgi:hypothetical protein